LLSSCHRSYCASSGTRTATWALATRSCPLGRCARTHTHAHTRTISWTCDYFANNQNPNSHVLLPVVPAVPRCPPAVCRTRRRARPTRRTQTSRSVSPWGPTTQSPACRPHACRPCPPPSPPPGSSTCPTGMGGVRVFFPLVRRSHSISFTRAQGIPKYTIGFGRGNGWVGRGGITGPVTGGGELPSLAVMLATCQFIYWG
jgi:hypothetical protein